MLIVHNTCDFLEEMFNLLGRQKPIQRVSELVELVKKFKDKTFTIGRHKIILDKQDLSHILGHHPPLQVG
jgi:hypothetical protein